MWEYLTLEGYEANIIDGLERKSILYTHLDMSFTPYAYLDMDDPYLTIITGEIWNINLYK